MKEIRLSVLVPAYNEKENLEPLAEEFQKLLRKTRIAAEVVIIDDGSTDGTYEEGKRLSNKFDFLKVASHKKNLGKTAALVTGYRISKGENLVIFDADMQFDPWDIPKMLDRLDEGYDIVTGKKIGKYQKPFISGIYNWFCRKLFKVPVSDLNSMKLFRRDVMKGLPLRDDWHRYMVVLAMAQGYTVSEIDVKLSPRLHGESKYTGIWRMFIGFFDLLAVWFLLTFTRKPMLFFGTLGLFALITAFGIGVFALVLRFVYDSGYRPLLTLITLLAQAGFTLFIFGALAEMIASLREKIDFIYSDSNREIRHHTGNKYKSKAKPRWDENRRQERDQKPRSKKDRSSSSKSISKRDKKTIRTNTQQSKTEKPAKRIVDKAKEMKPEPIIVTKDEKPAVKPLEQEKAINHTQSPKDERKAEQEKKEISYGRSRRKSKKGGLSSLREADKSDNADSKSDENSKPAFDRSKISYGRGPRRAQTIEPKDKGENDS